MTADAANRHIADDGSGFGVSYPQPLCSPPEGWEHRDGVSGQRLPDMDLVLMDGSVATLYSLLEKGRSIRLQFTRERLASDDDGVRVVELSLGTGTGLLADLTSALVRPDGYLGHVRQ